MESKQVKTKTCKCEKCGIQYEIGVNTYYGRKRRSLPSLCKKCSKEVIVEIRKAQFSNMTKEQQEAYRNKQKEIWNKKSEAEKKAYSERTKQQLAQRTEEEKKEINKKNSEGLKKHWEGVNKDAKKKRIEPMIKANKIKLSNMSKEELSARGKHIWEVMDSEDKEKRIEELRQRMIEYNDSLPYEEKIRRVKCMQEWHNNLTQEQKDEFYKRTHQWYFNLTPEERREHDRKRLASATKENKLCKKFEEMFNNSILINDYYLGKKECSLINNGGSHHWDYPIYSLKDNSLQMVVDIDGKYYHGDQNDYDGIHSTEEDDERRYLTLPGNLKSFIINELMLKQSFELMMKQLMMNYDDYIQSIFDYCRIMPFPYPNYTNMELINSMKSLCKMNCNDNYHKNISMLTKAGHRIIQHFHHSIYHAHVGNKPSPYEAWYNDDLLRKCIKNRIIYQSYLNPNKILQGFNVSKIAPKVSVFSAGRAKLIINKYLNEFNEIFDPFSGFSGRMLGAISLNKTYIGYDINEIHVKESNDIIERFNLSAKITQQDILSLDSYESHECLFTCPPYSDKELWIYHDKDQNKSCDEWIDICLSKFNCRRYVFIVDQTERYQSNISYVLFNKSHFSYNEEYIIIIDR